jgi:tRNA1(Val) A37 N6-methylase TrmN6
MSTENQNSSNPKKLEDRSVGRFRRAFNIAKDEGVTGIIRSARKTGIRNSLRFVGRNLRFLIAVQADRRFDRCHGVDTGGSIQLGSLSIESPNRAFGNEYVSTSPKSFSWIMRSLPRNLSRYCFIDMGAGKGRTLLLAAQYDFKHIIGVEFARELVEVARHNLERMATFSKSNPVVEIIQADATQFDYPREPLVIYFYNPFSADVFTEVMSKLTHDLQKAQRECFVVYASTMEGTLEKASKVIKETGLFEHVRSNKMPLFFDAVRSIRFAVFKTRDQASRCQTST